MALDWGWSRDQRETALLRNGRAQLQAYFDQDLNAFDLPLVPSGTVYRLKVWDALRQIPFGTTLTYTDLANRIGGSARAIGQAHRYNPLPILIPCHRVVARRGIGGFTGEGGTDTKRFLLDHEGDR